MGVEVEEVRLVVKSEVDKAIKDIKQYNDGLKESEKKAQNLKNGFRNLTVAILAVGFAMSKVLKVTSNLEEQTAKFNTVFRTTTKDMSKSVKDLTSNYLLSERAAKQYLASTQDLLVPMGMLPDAAAKMSENIVKLSADLGSFNNLPTAQVMADIQSALVGNFETVKKYGVILNETVIKERARNEGLWNGKGAIDAATKAQLAYKIITESSSAAIGDITRTQGSYANQMKGLKASLEDLTAAFGQLFLPVATAVISSLRSAANAILALPGPIKTLLSVIVTIGIAIAVLTKVVTGFGVALSAAIWPVTAVVLAIAGIVAVIALLRGNWDVVTAKMNLGIIKLKKGFQVMWSFVKIGFLQMAKIMLKIAGVMFTPHFKAINLMITAYNKLTNNNIKQIENLGFKLSDSAQRQIEVERAKLETLRGMSEEERIAKEEIRLAEEAKEAERREADSEAIQQKSQKDAKTRIKGKQKEIKGITALDTALLKFNQNKFKLQAQHYQTYSSFMLANLNKNSAAEFQIWKAFSIAQAVGDTYRAANSAYAAMAGIPFVGPALGAGAAATAIALGLRNVNNIRKMKLDKAENGALIQGSKQGTPIIAGDGNKKEMIVPFENEEVMERFREATGGSGGNNITINVENLFATEDVPREMAIAIDRELYTLRQDNNSTFATAIEGS